MRIAVTQSIRRVEPVATGRPGYNPATLAGRIDVVDIPSGLIRTSSR
jgi:hypothetical protein